MVWRQDELLHWCGYVYAPGVNPDELPVNFALDGWVGFDCAQIARGDYVPGLMHWPGVGVTQPRYRTFDDVCAMTVALARLIKGDDQ